MNEAESLLRSAYAIACRRGANTNWDAFLRNVEKELCLLASANQSDRQQVLRATCTPKTYYLHPSQQEHPL